MDPDFWHERWARDEIGFHRHEYNAHMTAFMHRLALTPGAHVLVPLCGKSLDLEWLLREGYQVTGIEISPRAIEAFFAENALPCERDETRGVPRYRHGRLSIWCTDFFEFDFSAIDPVDAVYDRASLVALPRSMRENYASVMLERLPEHAPMLLITLDYPQAEMRGPPFAVTREEVERLYGGHWRIEEIHDEDCLADEPRMRKKGLSRLHERVYLLNVGHAP
jgi:thiopurine S-methyltransferase